MTPRFIPKGLRIVLFSVLCSVSGLSGEEAVPISVPSPARFFHLDFASDLARVSPGLRIGGALRTANLWNHPSVFTNSRGLTFDASGDGELVDGEIHVAVPVLSWLEFQGEVNATLLHPGWMDKGIEAWHSLFHIRTHDRENYPQNQEDISLGALSWDSPQFFINTASLKAKSQFVNLPFLAMALRADISVPVGSFQVRPEAGPDLGVGLLTSFEPWRWVHLHSSLALVFMSRENGLPEGLSLNSPQPFFDLAVWIAPLETFRFFLGHKYIGAMFRQEDWTYVPRNGVSASENETISSSLASLFRETRWIYFGLQLALSKNSCLSLFVLEDLWIKTWSPLTFEGNDSPDLLIGLRFTWKNR